MANAANGTNWFKTRIFWCSIEIENRLLLNIASRDSSSVSSYEISPEGRMVCSAVIKNHDYLVENEQTKASICWFRQY